ncbi:MAG: hypothetical protein H5T59_06745 [Anaerolineae bacterium]|nr:hypothetical protein [Anaerolineae bacterium]
MKDPRRLLAEEALMHDILEAQVETLADGEDDALYLRLFPHLRGRLAPLFSLARYLQQVLVPVRPSPQFRENLREGLLTAARQRALMPAHRPPWRPHREWVIGAAAVGSAMSLAGVAAFLIRRAQQRAVTQDLA